jgi:uncharacterized repeat protein (TIGR01451 family)
MRLPGWPIWRLSELLPALWAPSPQRGRSTLPLQVEPLECRLAPVADLTVTKIDEPDPVAPGGRITYTLTVENVGDTAAASVQMLDAVPANTTFVSFNAPPGWSSLTPPPGGGGTVTSTTNLLAAGASATFILVVQVDPSATTPIDNTATVSSPDDLNLANNTATQQTALVGPDLRVTSAGTPGPVRRGDTITYTITVTNPGPRIASDVTITDTLPDGTTFVSFTAPAGFTTMPPVAGNNLVTSTTASLPPGTAEFTLVVRVTPAMLSPFIQNRVSLTSLNETNLGDNFAQAETAVIIPALPISGFEDTSSHYTVARFTLALGVPLQAVIDWGDGTATPGVITREDEITFVVTGTHTYTDESPHGGDRPFPLSVMVFGGNRRFDMDGSATIVDRPFPSGGRGSAEDRWLAEIQDNLQNPSLRSLNRDDASRWDFASQWNTLYARELARTRNIRKARRNVARRILTSTLVGQITTEILGGVPRRLRFEEVVKLIDAFYIRYLEHGDRGPSWDLAVTTMLRVSRRESVVETIRFSLAEFMSSDEFFNKTVR